MLSLGIIYKEGKIMKEEIKNKIKVELLKYPTDYLTRYIKSLDMPNETKDFFYELTSPSKEKKYIDNNLDNLSSSKSFLKKY